MTDIEALKIQLRATQKALVDTLAHNRALKARLEQQADLILNLMFPTKRKGERR